MRTLRTVRAACFAVAVLALAVPAGASSASSGSGNNGSIAFVRYTAKSGHPRVFIVRASGGAARPVRLRVEAAQAPSLSGDGRRLAFVGGANPPGEPDIVGGELYVSSPRGSGVRRLTRDRAQESSASFSADGKHLVFVRSGGRNARSSLWIARATGGTATRLTDGRSVDTEPSWSARGWIAFLRIDPAIYQSAIWTIRPDGSHAHRILEDLGVLTNPVWSPDGTRLLVQDGHMLVTIRADGSDRRLVTRLATDARGNLADPQPSWSPDGAHIVYCQLRTGSLGRSDIWVVGADGRGQRRLTRSPEIDSDPSWGG